MVNATAPSHNRSNLHLLAPRSSSPPSSSTRLRIPRSVLALQPPLRSPRTVATGTTSNTTNATTATRRTGSAYDIELPSLAGGETEEDEDEEAWLREGSYWHTGASADDEVGGGGGGRGEWNPMLDDHERVAERIAARRAQDAQNDGEGETIVSTTTTTRSRGSESGTLLMMDYPRSSTATETAPATST
ncbi:hypothetical protein HKX48_009431, partial [Thoreauomyces humboldtii]